MVPVRFGLLGPIEIVTEHGERVTLVRRQVRAMLAILLLEPNRTVSTRRLCTLLWDDAPSACAVPSIRCVVARLRAGLAGLTDGLATVVSRDGGYAVEVDAEAVDVQRFRNRLRQARQTSDLEARERALGEALDLWRGEALQGCLGEPMRLRLCGELDEMRWYAIEARMSAGLAMGRCRDLLPELARLTGEHPTHESLAEMYMRALHHSGRRADALQVFSRIRTRLVEDLGMDPGESLHRTQREILNA